MHPIAKTPLYVVYPSLRPFRICCGCIPQMAYEERKPVDEQEMADLLAGQDAQNTVMINGRQVIKKKKAKPQKYISPKAADDEPLSQLGFGIVAYVNMLFRMTWIFILFTILLVPTMHAYR